MILHLLRHGQSVWNVEERVQGQTHHVPLTADGVRQAREARERLAGVPLAAVLSSDQVRARQTADVVAAAHGLPVRETELLREQGLGELEGRRYSELQEEATPEGVHVSEVRWGGGESMADVAARLRVLVDQLRAAMSAVFHGVSPPSLPPQRPRYLSHGGDICHVIKSV